MHTVHHEHTASIELRGIFVIELQCWNPSNVPMISCAHIHTFHWQCALGVLEQIAQAHICERAKWRANRWRKENTEKRNRERKRIGVQKEESQCRETVIASYKCCYMWHNAIRSSANNNNATIQRRKRKKNCTPIEYRVYKLVCLRACECVRVFLCVCVHVIPLRHWLLYTFLVRL